MIYLNSIDSLETSANKLIEVDDKDYKYDDDYYLFEAENYELIHNRRLTEAKSLILIKFLASIFFLVLIFVLSINIRNYLLVDWR